MRAPSRPLGRARPRSPQPTIAFESPQTHLRAPLSFSLNQRLYRTTLSGNALLRQGGGPRPAETLAVAAKERAQEEFDEAAFTDLGLFSVQAGEHVRGSL